MPATTKGTAPSPSPWISEDMKVHPFPWRGCFDQKLGLYPKGMPVGTGMQEAPHPPHSLAEERRARLGKAKGALYHCEVKSTNSAENFSAGSCGDGSSTTCFSCWNGVPQES